MHPMTRAILIAHGHPGDALHDRAFEIAPRCPSVAWLGVAANDAPASFERTAAPLRARYDARMEHARTVGPGIDGNATRQLIATADLIYLGGGDVTLLAERLRALELDTLIRARAAAGAIVVGISAGAIGLTRWWVQFPDEDDEGEEQQPRRFACIGAVDLAIDVHDEESDWEELRALLACWARDEPEAIVDAYGIPSTGALEVAEGRVTALGAAPFRLRLDRGRVIE
jgi:hypothetical protein